MPAFDGVSGIWRRAALPALALAVVTHAAYAQKPAKPDPSAPVQKISRWRTYRFKRELKHIAGVPVFAISAGAVQKAPKEKRAEILKDQLEKSGAPRRFVAGLGQPVADGVTGTDFLLDRVMKFKGDPSALPVRLVEFGGAARMLLYPVPGIDGTKAEKACIVITSAGFGAVTQADADHFFLRTGISHPERAPPTARQEYEDKYRHEYAHCGGAASEQATQDINRAKFAKLVPAEVQQMNRRLPVEILAAETEADLAEAQRNYRKHRDISRVLDLANQRAMSSPFDMQHTTQFSLDALAAQLKGGPSAAAAMTPDGIVEGEKEIGNYLARALLNKDTADFIKRSFGNAPPVPDTFYFLLRKGLRENTLRSENARTLAARYLAAVEYWEPVHAGEIRRKMDAPAPR